MAQNPLGHPESNPLADLDEWEEFLRDRYPAPARNRRFATTARPRVRPSASSTVSITAFRPSTSSRRKNASIWS